MFCAQQQADRHARVIQSIHVRHSLPKLGASLFAGLQLPKTHLTHAAQQTEIDE